MDDAKLNQTVSRYSLCAYFIAENARANVPVTGLVVPLVSCSLVDFSVPTRKNSFQYPYAIFEEADKSATSYKTRANDLADNGIVFEAPAAAASIGTGFTAIFRGSLREIQAFGLAAVSFVGADQYFAPRDRARLYFDAGRQMGCIATLAKQTSFHIWELSDKDGTKPHLSRRFLYAIKLLHITTDSSQKAALLQITTLQDTAVQQLARAMDTIDSAALSNGLAKSNTNPGFATLASSLVSSTQTAFTTQSAATSAVTSKSPAQQLALTNDVTQALTASPPAAPAVPALPAATQTAIDLTSVQDLIAFAANFNVALTSCLIGASSPPPSSS